MSAPAPSIPIPGVPNTRFIDFRALWGGGEVTDAQLRMWTGGANFANPPLNYIALSLADLQSYVYGKDVLLATHGFNNDRAQGIEALSRWGGLLTLPDSAAYVGVLWPGDSESLKALCYPEEPAQAMDAGARLGAFVEQNLQNAKSISFASHSLGARVILNAITSMTTRQVRRAIVMAGAVDDHCLTQEFSCVQQQVDVISVLASQEDDVLRWAFPIGDLAAEIVDRDHPWWESALGRFGPAQTPQHYQPPCQIPKEWGYGHDDYLRTDPPAPEIIPAPGPVPAPATPPAIVPDPLGGVGGWQEAWSASVASTRFS